MNAKRVTLHSLGEGGYASAGFADVCEDATAVKPWSFAENEHEDNFEFLMLNLGTAGGGADEKLG